MVLCGRNKFKYRASFVGVMLVVTPICFIVLSPGTSDSGSPERHVYDSNSLGRNNHRSKILNKDEDVETKVKEFKERRLKLQNACREHEDSYRGHFTDEKFRKHLLHNNASNLVFCGVEKVGLTFWRRVFISIENPVKVPTPFHIRAFDAYQDIPTMLEAGNKMESILNMANTIMFSRNPFERLYSAYADKFLNPNFSYMLSFGERIIKTYRRNATREEKFCGRDVTFSEFVKFRIEYEHGKEDKDNHFTTITEHCRPCDVRYKYVGKMETFFDDIKFILERFNISHLHKFIPHMRNEYLIDSLNHITDVLFFDKQKFVDHKCFTFSFALRRSWQFLQTRGIISNKVIFPFAEGQISKISKKEFFDELQNALKLSSEDPNRKQQKKIAIINAYSEVSASDMKELQRIFEADCNLFGYDCIPPR